VGAAVGVRVCAIVGACVGLAVGVGVGTRVGPGVGVGGRVGLKCGGGIKFASTALLSKLHVFAAVSETSCSNAAILFPSAAYGSCRAARQIDVLYVVPGTRVPVVL